MINGLCENEYGYMEGTFYSDILGYDIKVMYRKEVPQEYVERNIEYLNHLDQDFLREICVALKRFYEGYKEILPDLCEDIEEDVLGDFEMEPLSILKHIDIGVCKFGECKREDEDIPVIHLSGDCAWSGDEGVTIAAKNQQLLYVGPWEEINVWTGSVDVMFNYAMGKG